MVFIPHFDHYLGMDENNQQYDIQIPLEGGEFRGPVSWLDEPGENCWSEGGYRFGLSVYSARYIWCRSVFLHFQQLLRSVE